MPAPENLTGPPLATAAHAQARRTRLFSQLRHSILLKIVVVCGVLLGITLAPLAWGQAPLAWFGIARIAFSIAVFALLVQVMRYLAGETLWLLRNRLILAYVFIGVVPVVLIAAMLAIGAYMFYGQYAAYLLLTDINQRTRNVGAVNTLTVRELDRHPERASEVPELSDYYASYYFPRGFGGVHSYFFGPAGVSSTPLPRQLGGLRSWLDDGYLGLIYSPGGYAIASYRSTNSLPLPTPPATRRGTAASVPATPSAASREDVLTLYGLGPHNLDTLARPLGTVTLGSRFVNLPSTAPGTNPAPESAPRLTSTESLRPAKSIFDIQITSWAFLPVTDWNTGQQHTVLATIASRPTLLNDLLFASLPSENSEVASRFPLYLLAAIAIGFLIIEAFSLIAGIRLTRTITGAVNDLYASTEHVNRGDFDHRIQVRSRDQLAALAIAFNNMIASVGRLLKEQRLKQQLESELSIAHEVQAQLFPRTPPQVAGLEIAGRCLAARVVSGDYYDFSQLSPNQISLALGDISGKGISAALLMATIVAAVRAFQPSVTDVAVGALAGPTGYGEFPAEAAEPNPAHLLNRLNRQLFHSTPPEKYATMFYAIYEATRRELRYTNAGHLPPAVIGAGGVRRLDRGGMVVGLFEDVMFDQGVIELEPGDLLAAWSDGITEPENVYGVEFGEGRLLQLLEDHRGQPLPEVMEAVLNAVHEWTGTDEQADDITLVLARVH